MLLTASDRLSTRQLTRLRRILDQDDPPDEIGAAWGCKELLRQLLAETDPDRIRHRLWRFYDACARAEMDETTRLACTIETWWPAIAVALTEQVTNARTEGFNRIIKQVKRVGCGFATWTTINDASWPTSQSPDREDKQHDQATPLKCGEPVTLHLLLSVVTV